MSTIPTDILNIKLKDIKDASTGDSPPPLIRTYAMHIPIPAPSSPVPIISFTPANTDSIDDKLSKDISSPAKLTRAQATLRN